MNRVIVIQNKNKRRVIVIGVLMSVLFFLIFLTVTWERKYSRRECEDTRTILWEIFETMPTIQKKLHLVGTLNFVGRYPKCVQIL